MGLMDTLNQCISAGHEMTKAIAIAQFNDDSPEARKITRRWRIGEAADLVGVSSQAIRDAEKAGRLPHPDMETRGRVEQRVGYTIEQINHMRDVFGTRLRREFQVSDCKIEFLRTGRNQLITTLHTRENHIGFVQQKRKSEALSSQTEGFAGRTADQP